MPKFQKRISPWSDRLREADAEGTAMELTNTFGKGFSRSDLQNMRQLYLADEKCQTLSGKLG